MTTIVLVVHLLLALALVGVILIQRSEGGALGSMGGAGSGGGFGGLFTARGSANFLTRTTAILATCFLATSLLLAILASHNRVADPVLEGLGEEEPAVETPAEPAVPQAPVAD
ncbi:MAG: preprotein translocase subunit SecG [Geminicoccaceae bacterium]